MIQAQRSVLGRRALGLAPFTRPTTHRVRAEPENGVVASTTAVASPVIPSLTWYKDTETIRDVFAFAGPAPERVNGRVAMYAFAAIAFTEFNAHTPALEQFGKEWFGVIFFSLLISVASLLPKLAAGVPLKELHASATSANMSGSGWRQILGLFDQGTELWTGRVAMLGLTGLVLVEAIKGDAFF